ncbi:heme peroxidase [Macleaya cordata]|uniref:Heme peroxidase n=1 Tax=Macleaya cordata TaxID=56857 RepID=A0A200RA71_MACCD|nr:heme peroxidase [Macleaya cordata]
MASLRGAASVSQCDIQMLTKIFFMDFGLFTDCDSATKWVSVFFAFNLIFEWNDAGTYDVTTGKGGANGSIRHWDVLKVNAYSELGNALYICEEVKRKCPRLTYADIIQFGGVVAVEIAGGPSIDFDPGRKDSLPSPDEAEFPDAKPGVHHRLSRFYRMGLTDDKDVVALTGGLTLGRAYRASLEREDTRYVAPVKFDNSYFVDFLRGDALGYMMSAADRELLETAKFRRYFELYAEDKEAFFRDYAVAHKKFSELGFKPSLSDNKVVGKSSTVLTQSVVVLAVAAAVVVLCYFFKVHKRVE